jgi:hypothetical protein
MSMIRNNAIPAHFGLAMVAILASPAVSRPRYTKNLNHFLQPTITIVIRQYRSNAKQSAEDPEVSCPRFEIVVSCLNDDD